MEEENVNEDGYAFDEIVVWDVGVEASDIGCLDMKLWVVDVLVGGGDGECSVVVEVVDDVDEWVGVLHVQRSAGDCCGGDGGMGGAEEGVKKRLDGAEGIA